MPSKNDMPTKTPKRKHSRREPPLPTGASAEAFTPEPSSRSGAHIQSSGKKSKQSDEIGNVPIGLLSACRQAVLKGPAASRSTLRKHQSILDCNLTKVLSTVGDYDEKVSSAFLFISFYFPFILLYLRSVMTPSTA
jgi:hypothetical protein